MPATRTAVLARAAAVSALVLAPMAASSASVAATSFKPDDRLTNSTSGNWSGYAATGSRFTSISATWTQPAGTCGSQTTYSSFWVGLDGDTSGTVEQTGSEVDCSGGSPVYTSWYEMYPKFPVYYSDTVRAGDVFHGSVTTNGNGSFTLTLTNSTEGWSHTINASLRKAKLASAEAIAEAPSSSGGVLPLTDFGTVGFSSVQANGQAIGNFNPDQITMVTSTGAVKAQPSGLSGGSSFSVAWKHS